MASKQEKSLLGLPETATDEDVVKRIGDLVAAEQLVNGSDRSSSAGKIAVISRGPSTRRGTYMIPAASGTPLVLEIATIEPRNLGEIEGDPNILKLRSDAPVTPASEVSRYTRT
jgi:hypothetical protein